VGNDGRVTVGKEGSIRNVRVGGGGVGAGNRGSGRIDSRHPLIRNRAAYHPCRSRTVTRHHPATSGPWKGLMLI
jgi:hypothetical protein